MVPTHQARVQPKTALRRFFLVSVEREPGVWPLKQISCGRLDTPHKQVKGFSLNYFVRVLPKKRLHNYPPTNAPTPPYCWEGGRVGSPNDVKAFLGQNKNLVAQIDALSLLSRGIYRIHGFLN